MRLLFAILCLLIPGVARAAPPETYYYMVFSNPVAGMEAEYNRWYDQQHVLEVVSIPGFKTAQRFVVNERQLAPKASAPALPRYLVIYKIVTNDLPALFKEVGARVRDGRTVMSPAYDRTTSRSFTYRFLGPEIKGSGVEPKGARPGAPAFYDHIVFTVPVEGKEAEFNTWYDAKHGPEMAGLPGFVNAQRLILVDEKSATPATKYMAVFAIRTADEAAVFDGYAKLYSTPAGAAPGPRPGAVIDGPHTYGYTYRAIGPLVDGDAVRRAH